MLQQGIVQLSFSPWSYPVVMVTQDGTWRVLEIECCHLSGCIATHYPEWMKPWSHLMSLPTHFTTLDLASGYWKVV